METESVLEILANFLWERCGRILTIRSRRFRFKISESPVIDFYIGTGNPDLSGSLRFATRDLIYVLL